MTVIPGQIQRPGGAANQGSLAEGAAALKAGPCIGRIALSGSVSAVRQLLAASLPDELHLFAHHGLAGSGLRLFQDGFPEQPLRLLSSQPFATGVIHLVYAPDPNPPAGNCQQAKENLPQGVTSSSGRPRPARRSSRAIWLMLCPAGEPPGPPPAASLASLPPGGRIPAGLRIPHARSYASQPASRPDLYE